MLAEKLGLPLSTIMAMPSDEISGWMAYDLSNTEAWRTEYDKEKELERQRAMSAEEKAEQFRRLFGK